MPFIHIILVGCTFWRNILSLFLLNNNYVSLSSMIFILRLPIFTGSICYQNKVVVSIFVCYLVRITLVIGTAKSIYTRALEWNLGACKNHYICVTTHSYVECFGQHKHWSIMSFGVRTILLHSNWLYVSWLQIPGLVNVDFADVRTIMANAGSSLMGIGAATGK